MKEILFTCISVIVFHRGFSQPFDSTLAKYAADYQNEKAYLHYDKSSYYSGETIWFKAYLIEDLFPAKSSKTLYIDWISDNGAVLSHSVSPLVDAVTNGQFEIPLDYSGSFIHVRAYTKWMLNFDTAFLYSKNIRILPKKLTKSSAPSTIYSLQLFPEGGDLIAGTNNKIAFKATDQWGIPFSIKGVIQDNKGLAIASFHPIHDGMGSFYFIPQEEMKYTVKWKDEKGIDHSTPLPEVRPAGVSMQVSVNGAKRIIILNSSNQSADKLKQLHLVGTFNKRIAFKTDVSIPPANSIRRIVPTENLPSGILTITLFDADWNALAERITFINNQDYSFQPSMEVQRWGLSKRKRNEIEITIPDSLQSSNLSISVTDAAIEKDTTDNIISHFLLTSEIKGKVYRPTYYFSNNSDSVAQHLDLVMLTHGWRRFKWEDIAKGKLPALIYPRDSSYLILSGKVFGVTKGQLSGKDNIALIIKEKDSSTKMLIMPIQSNGEFSDPGIVFFDTVHVYYSLKSKFFSQAEARFMTDRLPAPDYTAFIKNFLNRNPFYDTVGSYRHARLAEEAVRLQELQKGKLMEAVIIKTKQKTPVEMMDEKYASGMFKSGDGYQFDLVNDPFSGSYQNILFYLQGKVAGLQIGGSAGTPSLSWRGGSPQLYLDEIPTDADMINTIPVSDIAYVKVFRPPFMGGFNGANGAIVVYTRKGVDTQNTPGKGLSANKISGYTPIKQFYTPNYDRFDPRNEQADIRTTLYWNPLLSTTPKKNKLSLSFYNNDVSKSFRVVIEGMTKEGLLTHFEQIME